MTDIFNIGKSGLLATRDAMAVTGDNIANVNTPGYSRRELLTREQLPSGGVQVTDVRRAFDTLLAERQREATSSLGAAQVFQTHVAALEERLMPGPGGVTTTLDSFFDSLDSLAQTPDDEGLRLAVIGAGEALAAQVNDLAAGLDAQARGVEDERAQTVGEINDLLEALEVLELEISRTTDGPDRNPLLDYREAKLKELAEMVPITVDVDNLDRATVRLGTDPNGPVVLERGTAGRLTTAEDGRVLVYQSDEDAPAISMRPSSGALGGLADAGDVVASAREDLNDWAGRVASEINAIHGAGITPDGSAGGDMFLTSGWTAEPGALMRGDTVVETVITDADAMPEGPITLIRDDAAGLWRAVDDGGTVLAEGDESLALPGVAVSLSGLALDGDRISLTRSDVDAGFFRMGITNPSSLAAGAPLIVSADPNNTGNAALTVEPVSENDPAFALPDLAAALAGAEAVEFVSAGAVGVIPAGTESAVLSAQPRLAAMDFTWPAGETATDLSFTRGADSYAFTSATALTPEAFATALNDGTLTAATGETLRELGLVAEVADGALTLLDRSGGLPDSATLTTSVGPATGVDVASAAGAADLAIFTRDGRQIAGPPLNEAEIAAFLTPENGFDPDAQYSAEGLSDSDGVPLVSRASSAGDYTLRLPDPAGGGIESWSAGAVPPENAARALSVDIGTGVIDVPLPSGASAAWAADILNDALPIAADAETRLDFSAPSTGTLNFTLAGSNTTPVSFALDLADGPEAVANAINAQAPNTGVRAELSSDGTRLELVHDGGADITFQAVSHSGGGTLDLTRLGPDGAALSAVSLGGAGDDAARLSGTLTLTGAADFSVLEGATVTAAAQDPFANGTIDIESADAGTTLILQPETAAEDDLALREISVTGADGRVHDATADPALAGTQSLAEGLAESLRATAPTSRIEGAAVATLPPEGARMVVSLGDQDYTITMRSGVPEVEGPELGRVTASFDAANQLTIETVGGHLDGAALQLTDAAGEATLFGMGASQAPVTTVMGEPFDAASLPSSFTVNIGGVSHAVTVSTGGVVLPPSFPGTGYINTAFGRVEIQFDAREGDFSIPAQAGAADAGFDTLGLTATVEDGALALTATDGRAIEVTSAAAADGTTLSLTEVPDEDLIVILSGSGGLRLAGDITEGTPAQPVRELRVLDADARSVGLFDAETGAQLATRTLDPSGTARFGDLEYTLQGALATGDTFTITPNPGSAGDGRTMGALADLRMGDPETGAGGFAASFASIQQRTGSQVATGEIRLATAEAAAESAERAVSELGGVDLDEEAARLVQQQQAYQANAQVIGVAREIFDTLLQAI